MTTLAAAILADFDQETQKTRKVLEVVPDGRFEWKPHEKSMTLGQLAGHVAENPVWVHAMMEDETDFSTAMSDYQPFDPKSRADVLAAFDRNAGTLRDLVGGRDDAFMLRTWTMRMGEKVLMVQPRHSAIRFTAIHHWVHHRGQLTVYLRLLGVPLPQIYGPTADDASFG